MGEKIKEFLPKIINDVSVYEQNRLSAHAELDIACVRPGHNIFINESAETLSSDRIVSLDGEWNFAYAENLQGVIDDFFSDGYDCHGWDGIRVPGHMQLQGYDKPHYTNTAYPWDGKEDVKRGDAPHDFNPIGMYVKYFEVPAEYIGRHLRISFQGVESGFAVWLNGEYIGYSENSFDPAEFDITDQVREGENKLSVEVFKWTSGSWCEDQDFFRFSGIYRSVYIYYVPEVHIEDVKLRSLLNDDFTSGYIEAECIVSTCTDSSTSSMTGVEGGCPVTEGKASDSASGHSVAGAASHTGDAGYELKFTLKDPARDDMIISEWTGGLSGYGDSGDNGAEVRMQSPAADYISGAGRSNLYSSSASAKVQAVRLWSAEQPNLYTLEIRLCDGEDRLIEKTSQVVGFRRFEMKNGLMLINGKRIVFKGVNRHEFSSRTGRTVSDEELLLDIVTMKRNNINAIRTCHYPDDVRIYDLCDRYGLYMIAENNMETHGSWIMNDTLADIEKIVPGDDERWAPLLLDRVNSCYQRDKNHPAILIWSIGNESYGGPVLQKMTDLFHRLDPDRLVHYEGVFHDRRFNGTSDMESQMYPSVADIKKHLLEDKEKPFICCEYTHAMGNSCGGMHKYTDLSDEEPRYQGGFIWDYIDQSLWKKNRYGEDFQAYGGDFGDRPSNYEFSGNGIVYGDDRTPSPKMQEVKYNYQNISVIINDKKVKIKNKNLFTNTSEYDCVAELYLDGDLISSHAIETDVEPLSEKEYELPFYGRETEICSDTGEYLIIVSFRMKYDTAWCERGHEVAFGQYSYFSEDIRYNNSSDPDDSLVGRHGNSIGDSIRFIEKLTAGSGGPEQKQREFSPLQIIKGHENIGVRGDDFSCLFSLNMGGLVSYEYKKKQLIGETPTPNFWRAPTDNDRGAGYDRYYAQWKTGSLYREHRTDEYIKNGPEMKLNEDGTFDIVFRFFLMTSPIAIVNVSYKVYPDGMIRMGLDHDPKGVISQIAMLGLMAGYDEEETLHQMNEWSDEESIAGIRAVGALPDMPEFGFLFRLDADFDRIRWYGLGPDETYADRKRGGRLGIYENRVIDNMARYLRPQECGSKEDVRYIEVTDEKGDGLIFVSDGMCASALPYTPHEIENAMHAYELPPIHHTIIRVALAQMGIGGDDSWGARVHPEYHIDMSEPLHFEVAFRGCRADCHK